MNNKAIQEERMKTYFLDSAKNLLKAEGLKGISVRNVAHHAGYSYATLYNYFQDINELLFRCVADFCGEAVEFAQERTKSVSEGKSRLRAAAKAYVEYFVEYPGVFELFFLEKMGDFSGRKETAALVTELPDRICLPHWNECVEMGIYTADEAVLKREELRCILPGMLLLYENRLSPGSYEEFMGYADDMIGRVIK